MWLVQLQSLCLATVTLDNLATYSQSKSPQGPFIWPKECVFYSSRFTEVWLTYNIVQVQVVQCVDLIR